jgi:hypothetical protein
MELEKWSNRTQLFIYRTTSKQGGPPGNIAANSNKYNFLHNDFTLTVWKMAKRTALQRLIFKVQNP